MFCLHRKIGKVIFLIVIHEEFFWYIDGIGPRATDEENGQHFLNGTQWYVFCSTIRRELNNGKFWK